MDIQELISKLQNLQAQGVAQVYVGRDMAPNGEIKLTSSKASKVAWISEVPDDITEMMSRAIEDLVKINKMLVAAGLPKGPQGLAELAALEDAICQEINTAEVGVTAVVGMALAAVLDLIKAHRRLRDKLELIREVVNINDGSTVPTWLRQEVNGILR